MYLVTKAMSYSDSIVTSRCIFRGNLMWEEDNYVSEDEELNGYHYYSDDCDCNSCVAVRDSVRYSTFFLGDIEVGTEDSHLYRPADINWYHSLRKSSRDFNTNQPCAILLVKYVPSI